MYAVGNELCCGGGADVGYGDESDDCVENGVFEGETVLIVMAKISTAGRGVQTEKRVCQDQQSVCEEVGAEVEV